MTLSLRREPAQCIRRSCRTRQPACALLISHCSPLLHCVRLTSSYAQQTSHLPYLSDPAYLEPPSLAALVIHPPRDLCLPRICLSFVPHLLYVSLQSSSLYRHGGSITNTLATPSPFASLNYGWTQACRRSSPSLAGCSWYFLSLD